MEYTATTAKAELPDVTVNYHGKIIQAQVAGRYCPWASVHPVDQSILQGAGWCFSWHAIARCLNENRPLKV